MKKQILLLAIMFLATLGMAQTDMHRAEGVTDQDWERLNSRPDYATADMLDMMKYYLMWFEWCDGWIADDVWTRAVEIERQHPQKFRELMASSKWYKSWQVFRDEYIEWEAKSKK